MIVVITLLKKKFFGFGCSSWYITFIFWDYVTHPCVDEILDENIPSQAFITPSISLYLGTM